MYNSETAPRTLPALPVEGQAQRVSSAELLKHARRVEIEHEGKIYELRVTRLNKLILTA